MRALWLLLVAAHLSAQAAPRRPLPLPPRHYWRVTVDQLATGQVAATHVAVVGRVRLVRWEADGDLHVQLTGRAHFIVAECIPALPCLAPPLGARLLVHGIARYDGAHHWWEVHPVEGWHRLP